MCMKELPVETIGIHFTLVDMAKVLYAMGKKEKAQAIIKKVGDSSVEKLEWAYGLKPNHYASAIALVHNQLYNLQEVYFVLSKYDKKLLDVYMPAFQKHNQIYQQSVAMRNNSMR